MKDNDEPRVTVACVGCGRTQTLRRSRLIRCDFYTCSLGRCNKNPDFKLPERPNDLYVTEFEVAAAGGFSGVRHRLMNPQDYESIKRARALMEAAKAKLSKP